ncbi:MAG: serine/threonine protein kinase [Myxococcales bacterium]|nr:serine/threonine protein kinase [Myxococcales bacterium]MCB9519276.1 serine/threonine protein kinase [Myxococcales bacterium]MCB9530720.1 serine/threonine protein kinase [Myxococcales bacterium]MCB9533386.1 serine/threonine protein kinase [Myxococcales bacterium]
MSSGDAEPRTTDGAAPQSLAAPPAADTLAPGTILRDTYRIAEFVGEGGAGAVYLAEHVNLGHFVAVKTLFGKYVRDAEMRRRFYEEAIIQANLAHPNIVRVFDVHDTPALCAIFMEYVEGSSLDRYLHRRQRPDAVETTARLFVPMLDAMAYAHSQGVVHRDLKPANVLLASGADGLSPKITDFGIAKILSEQRRTETGTAMGTVYYASPEQLTDAKSVDHRADVYSLGCTLYEMLTLKLPFEDATMFGVMKKHVQAPRPDPSVLNSEVPRDVAAIVMRAMAVDPKHRFQSCAEFAAELRRAVGISPVSTGPVSLTPSTSSGGGAANLALATPDFEAGVVPDRPVLQRTSPGNSGGPSRAVPSQTPTTRSRVGAAATTAKPTAQSSARVPAARRAPDAFRPPSREVTPVGKIIWGIIGLLGVGIVAALVFGRSEAPAPVAAPSAAVAAVAPVPTPEGSEAAPQPTSEPAADHGADAAAPPPVVAATPLDAEDCRALATKHAEFDGLGDITLSEAIAELETSLVTCERVLSELGAGSPFDQAVARLTSAQHRASLAWLRALRDNRDAELACDSPLAGATVAMVALRELESPEMRQQLVEFERESLAPFRRWFTLYYVRVRSHYVDCPYVDIAPELLDPEVLTPGEAGP